MAIRCAAYAQISVSAITERFPVSRQYVYILRNQLSSMSDVSPESLCQSLFKDQQILFTDDRFFEKTILSLALDGTASIEGIQRFLENVFQKHVSIGSISAILNRAADRAADFDRTIDLSDIRQGANDEIFQCQMPVLTGVDPISTYTYLLKPVSNRSADTWMHAMEECRERNLDLEVSISDFGKGLLSGIPKVFTGIEFQGDLFHWLTELGKEVSAQERKAYSLLSDYYQKLDSLSGQRVHEKTFQKLDATEDKLRDTLERTDLLEILYSWLRESVQPQGYPYGEALNLCRWILEQMEMVPGITGRLQKTLKKTRKHLPDVLRYLKRIEKSFRDYARSRNIPEDAMLLLYRMQSYRKDSLAYRSADRRLRHILKKRYEKILMEMVSVMAGVKRASSMVENLNGRLRRYMNLKRIIPEKFLTLLKVYFNTRPYRRSRVRERVGKSPLELLTGQNHPDFYDIVLG